MNLLVLACCAGALASQGGGALKDHSIGTFAFDAVELIDRSKETKGSEGIYADRYGYRYLFATAANRSAFLKEPQKYEIQLGGACGRMGPLSGRGAETRYAVVKGKLYLFASDGCRTGFLAGPEKLLESDDPKPGGTAAQAETAEKALRKLAEWCGGSKILSKNWYRETQQETVVSGGTTYDHRELFAIQFPRSIAQVSKWNESEYRTVSTGIEGFFQGSDGAIEPMHPQQARAQQRLRDHRLFTLLKFRGTRGFIAFADGESEGLSRIRTWFGGSGATLWIESETGKPRAMEFVARGPGSVMGLVKREFTEFGESEGIRLPTGWTATFEGAPNASLSKTGLRFFFDGEGVSFDKGGR
jgi:YHS domain-containing protein